MEAIISACITGGVTIVGAIIMYQVKMAKLVDSTKEIKQNTSELSHEHDKLGTQLSHEHSNLSHENDQLKASLLGIAGQTKFLDEQKKIELVLNKELRNRELNIDETVQQLKSMVSQLGLCYVKIEHLESENAKLRTQLKAMQQSHDRSMQYDEDEDLQPQY